MRSVPIKEQLMDAAVYFDQLFSSGLRNRHATVNCVFHGDRSPSLSLDLSTGKYHCFGCGSSGGDILDFHRALHPELSFADALREVSGSGTVALNRPLITESPKKSDRPAIIWAEAVPLRSRDAAAKYLRNRGLEMNEFPASLRFHDSLGYWERNGDEWILVGRYPAMVGRIDGPAGELVGVHATFLTEVGQKAPVASQRKIITVQHGALKGSAIRLFPAAQSLAITEGIETGLAVNQLSGLSVWAGINTYALEHIELPTIAQKIYIGFDNDKSGAGLNAATKLARRLEKEHRQVLMVEPPGGIPKGSKSLDWLDVLNRNHANDSTEFYARTIFSAS